jgi:uncharacterized membrane protein YeiH
MTAGGPVGQFQLNPWFDLSATFFFAVTGALIARRKGYDVVGVLALAFATGAGGGLLRDAVFLNSGIPLVITDARYLLVMSLAAAICIVFGRPMQRLQSLFVVFDALGLGAYAVVGAQKSISFGLPIPAAILIGILNAVGGGLLRDVLARDEPMLFRPSEYYAIAAFLGCSIFLGLSLPGLNAQYAAIIAIAATFLFRMLAVRFGWKSAADPL